MKLDDFLKTQKMRCVKAYGDCLTVGKEYSVLNIRMEVEVRDDEGGRYYWESDHFEPVLDSAENPLQNIELTPEFEVVEPTFKVGDKVYYSTDKEIYTISEIDSENSGLAYLSQNDDDWDTNAILKFCCHATQENYEMLCKLYPHIKFEQPPKPLSGDDIVKAMLKKGIKNVLCLWGSGDKIIIDRLSYKGGLMSTNCNIVGGLTPIDWYTGEPLTESILND